jgi:hypothetical protein
MKHLDGKAARSGEGEGIRILASVISMDEVMEQDGTTRSAASFPLMLRRKDGLSGGTQ